MARCISCKQWISGYEWTQTKTGKKWLYSIKEGKWHDCPNSKKTFDYGQKRIEYMASDYELCNFCGRMILKQEFLNKYPNLSKFHQTISQHIQKFHINGEIMDDIDFMCITDEQKQVMRIKLDKPKRTTPYHITSLVLE